MQDWSAAMERPTLAVTLARDLTARRPGEARSWFLLARMLSASEHGDERLAALDRAIEFNPQLAEAHDLKAEQLGEAQRFDEAAAVCDAPVWQGRPPLILRGRRAWIEARRGEVDRAIELMRATLDESPDYGWGWRQLVEWCDRGRTVTDADRLAAAEGLIQAAPNSPTGYVYRGDGRLRAGDRDGARADFRHALDVAPSYGYAGMSLFDMHLEDLRLEDAAQVLAHLKEHAPGPFVTARAVQLAARRGDAATGLEGVRALCRDENPETWPLQAACTAVRAAGWEGSLRDVLDEAVRASDARSQVGAMGPRTNPARRLGLLETLRPAPGAGRDRHRGTGGILPGGRQAGCGLRPQTRVAHAPGAAAPWPVHSRLDVLSGQRRLRPGDALQLPRGGPLGQGPARARRPGALDAHQPGARPACFGP